VYALIKELRDKLKAKRQTREIIMNNIAKTKNKSRSCRAKEL